MIRIECQAQLMVRDSNGQTSSLTDAVPLLSLVDQTGSIAQAAALKGLSYRHAWGLLRAIETQLGGALIEKERGRGSALSELGRAVLRAQRLCGERLDGNMQALASEVAADLNRWLAPPAEDVRIHASHGYAVAALVTALVADAVPSTSNTATAPKRSRRLRAASAIWRASICRAASFARCARISIVSGSIRSDMCSCI
ncbi:hypothetical protein PPGU19_008810 [Paraburkholderia sp. PGU19]|nr:hypothetical protein PPGU19_008810 [Paraburkholderia sp. PGU19]